MDQNFIKKREESKIDLNLSFSQEAFFALAGGRCWPEGQGQVYIQSLLNQISLLLYLQSS